MLKTLLLAATLTAGNALLVQAQQPVRIKAGISNSVTDVGFFIADRKGYFRREGLEVELIPFDSGARMIAPFASGDLDVGAGGPSTAFYNAVARGIDVRIVADKGSTPKGRPISYLAVRRDHVVSGRYKGLADLRGMTIATAAPGGVMGPVLDRALILGGLRAADVERVYMGFPQQAVALRNKAIDAAFPTEPFVTETEKLGFITRFQGDDELYPSHQIAAVIFSGQFITGKGDAARRFIRAYLAGVRDYSDAIEDGRLHGAKGEEIVSILTQYTLVKDPAVHRAVRAVYINPDGHLNIDSLRDDLESFSRDGAVEGRVELAKAVDLSFVEAALRQLGPWRKSQH